MKRTGRCPECGFDWEGPLGDLAERLRAIPRHLEDALSACDETALRTRNEPLVWSPLEYAGHIRDVMTWYEERIRRVLFEERPQLTALAWSQVTERRQYHDEMTRAILAGVAEAAMSLSDLMRSLTSEQWSRVGVGSEGDERDVAILARRAMHEAVHHLMDVRRETVGRASDEAQPGGVVSDRSSGRVSERPNR